MAKNMRATEIHRKDPNKFNHPNPKQLNHTHPVELHLELVKLKHDKSNEIQVVGKVNVLEYWITKRVVKLK